MKYLIPVLVYSAIIIMLLVALVMIRIRNKTYVAENFVGPLQDYQTRVSWLTIDATGKTRLAFPGKE